MKSVILRNCLYALIALLSFYGCTEEAAVTEEAVVLPPVEEVWKGRVVNSAYVHSLAKVLTTRRYFQPDSSFSDTNPDNIIWGNPFSTIKIGKTFDSLSSGTQLHWSPQNGFIVFDFPKFFGGRVSNITIARLKVKLFQRSEFNDNLKFVVSVLDTTILSKTVRERVYEVQNAPGETAGYRSEITVDLKDRISGSGKVVVGIRAENAGQLFASVEYCKIEFEGEITRGTSTHASR